VSGLQDFAVNVTKGVGFFAFIVACVVAVVWIMWGMLADIDGSYGWPKEIRFLVWSIVTLLILASCGAMF
jgi:TM2 domain-containing membrane protein YozV